MSARGRAPEPGDIVITGAEAITPLGADAEATWQALLRGERAVRSWADLAAEGFPLDVACRLDDAAVWPEGAPLAQRRGRELGGLTARRALAAAGFMTAADPEGAPRGAHGRIDPGRIGVVVGTTMGESAVFEQARDQGSFDLAEAGGHVFAHAIATELALTGPVRSLGTACAAGNYAIGTAATLIRRGRADVVIAGGVEPFSRVAMLGFARMRAMAPSGCAPFGRGRRGMTLGEGAGLLVLESAEHARARGAAALAVVGGLGLAADAHHPTAPREDGAQMAAAMRAALDRTGITAADIGWLCAHGTGTPRSDAAEALAVRSVFGDGDHGAPPVSSLKGALGHSLGAATAVEAVAAVWALAQGVIPPNVGADEVDDLGVDVPLQARQAPDLRWVLSCGYAFGGLDSALALGRAA